MDTDTDTLTLADTPPIAEDWTIPPQSWTPLRAVVNALGGIAEDYLDEARRRGLDVDRTIERYAGDALVQVRDLTRLLGPERARLVAPYLPTLEEDLIELGLIRALLDRCSICDEDLDALLCRRGVLVAYRERDGRPVASRSGTCYLKRILRREWEASMPIAPGDWIPWNLALPALRDASVVPAAKQDHSRPQVETIRRLDVLDIRWTRNYFHEFPDSPVQSQRVEVLGIDLHRLAGIELPGMDLDAYGRSMKTALEAVLYPPVPVSLPFPEPEACESTSSDSTT